jgi:hypothetical protein
MAQRQSAAEYVMYESCMTVLVRGAVKAQPALDRKMADAVNAKMAGRSLKLTDQGLKAGSSLMGSTRRGAERGELLERHPPFIFITDISQSTIEIESRVGRLPRIAAGSLRKTLGKCPGFLKEKVARISGVGRLRFFQFFAKAVPV